MAQNEEPKPFKPEGPLVPPEKTDLPPVQVMVCPACGREHLKGDPEVVKSMTAADGTLTLEGSKLVNMIRLTGTALPELCPVCEKRGEMPLLDERFLAYYQILDNQTRVVDYDHAPLVKALVILGACVLRGAEAITAQFQEEEEHEPGT